MARRLRSNTMKRLCQTDQTEEFCTPDGGTLVYGSCKKHDFFMATIHCSAADIRKIAESLLEAASIAEANKGTQPTQEANK
jgi:hypothetical protein